jgi:thiol-disulfide isomerase/thioredoxin
MSLTLASVLHVAVLAAAPEAATTYAEAYHETAETGRPLVVLVGAEWCPGCRVMKSSTMPQVQNSGVLEQVAFAEVDYDSDQKLARQLTGGGMIPQLIMYRRDGDRWVRDVLVGSKSASEVQSFLRRGVNSGATAGKPRQAN